ncbi:MAG: hypothetical protein WC310_03030 [Patescibacteria group bacterium]|jgi:predicted nucleotidyltransferase
MTEFFFSEIEKYKYPDFLIDIIQDSLNIFLGNIGEDNLAAVVLHGSTAKGKITIIGDQLYSDVEFFVFVRRSVSGAAAEKIRNDLVAIKEKYHQKNRFFHVDFIIKKKCLMRFYQRNLLIYELKNAGKVLYGDLNILSNIPKIDEKNINLRAVNDIMLMRLRVFLKDFSFNPGDKEDYYALLKNVYQYLMAVVVFNKGILLPSGYDRYKYVEAHHEDYLFLGDRFFSNYYFSSRMKFPMHFAENERNVSFDKGYFDYAKEVVGGMFLVLRLLLQKNNLSQSEINEENVFSVLDRSADIFNDSWFDVYSLACRVRYLKQVVLSGKIFSLFKAFRPIKKKLVLAYLALCFALKKQLNGESPDLYLQLAAKYTKQLSYENTKFSLTGDFKKDFYFLKAELLTIYRIVF